MSEWGYLIFMVLILSAVKTRLERRAERRKELAKLERDIWVAKFWGPDAEREDKAYEPHKAKIAEQKDWKNNISFELVNWGAIAAAVAAIVWMSEDPSHILWSDGVIQPAGYVVLAAVLMYWGYPLIHRLEKAEKDVDWLTHMLEVVTDHEENMRRNSIENILGLKNRVDRLEGRSIS